MRFNPVLWPEGKGMDDDVGRAAYRKAGDLGLCVGFMCFTGLDKCDAPITLTADACAPFLPASFARLLFIFWLDAW